MSKTQKTFTIALLVLMSVSLAIATSITGQGSSFTFNITNCNATTPNALTCSPANIRFECSVQDPTFINQVSFRIDGTDYLTTENSTTPSQFYLNFNKPQEIITNLNPVVLDREQIMDTNSITVNAFEYKQLEHNCTTCPNTFTTTTIQACNVSNLKVTQYISSNQTCTANFNQTESCNYCDPDIITTLSTCTLSGFQNISYYDNNYTTCCLQTGLSEDCIINDPIYNNASQSCGYLIQDFNCTQDNTPVLNDKMNIACTLPTKDEYNCVVNVYQENNNGTNQFPSTLLSTSPEYKQTSGSILALSTEQETRTSFTTTQGLLNAYYTQKELRPETSFKTEVLCTNNATTLRSQELVVPQYHVPTDWYYRMRWVGDNTTSIFGTIILGVLIFVVVIFAVSIFRRRGRR